MTSFNPSAEDDVKWRERERKARLKALEKEQEAEDTPRKPSVNHYAANLEGEGDGAMVSYEDDMM